MIPLIFKMAGISFCDNQADRNNQQIFLEIRKLFQYLYDIKIISYYGKGC
ncbi:MAG: hypothetical protein K0R82_752 [Flavipsychrobacter sp.]|jgi:hypothetical protein|nr:hypothetical protein [Flavipsychrobacter sp.]